MALLLVADKVMTGYPDSVILESGQIVIGRLNTNHIVLADGKVEPIHAMVEFDSETGLTSIVDMASDLGVFLNGERIDVTAPLKSGDVITIGGAAITVKDHDLNASAKGQAKDAEGAKGQQPRVANARILFTAEKERRTGSTLEVVAFWDQSILDVRHYGGDQLAGEDLRSNKVILGNEHDGELIGVGPKANTRNLKLADVKGSKAVVYLNDEMRARVRRGARFEQIKGPSEVQLSGNDMALIQHGTISYFMTRVAVPNPVLKKVEELDGKPIIFAYASALYLIIAILLGILNASAPPAEVVSDEAWQTQFAVRTPTPKPTKQAEPPAPKPTVAIKTPPPQKSTPTPTPRPTQAAKPQPTAKPSATKPAPVQRPENQVKKPDKTPSEKPKSKDVSLGPKDPKAAAGNSGGKSGGTSGAFASQRQGNEKSSNAGTETGKEDLASLANLDKLGSELGKTINASGAGEIATGIKSNSGGAGKARGSGARGSFGMGGVGSGNSVSSGGPGDALKGLGAGGFGGGGDGAGGRRGGGAGGGKINISSVSAPASDSVVEGSLTKAEIEAVIKANLAKIKACYERRLQAKRDLAGRVLTRFVIAGSGSVSSASVENSDLGDGPTESCITNEIKRWKFPLPRGGGQVNVKYPFVFAPRS